jgi:hypothetical protein
MGQMSREKYPNHLIWYTLNISDPILSKKAKFPNIENTTTDKNFLLAKTKTARATKKETTTRKRDIFMSTLGSPKKSIFFEQSQRSLFRKDCF